MRNYITFLKKEWLEGVRSYKVFILLTVFVLLGMMNPLIAKLTPQIVSLAMPEGMNISVGDPSAMDSWMQFYKNVGQIGVFVIVLVFSGILSSELSKGTLINMLTKGLSRSAVILSKYTYMILMWTAALVIAFLITWVYTIYLFPDGGTFHLVYAAFCLWAFGVFLLSVLLLAAAAVKNTYGCLLAAGGVFVLCMMLNMLPAANKYNPLTLASVNLDLVKNAAVPSAYYWTLGTAGILSAGAVAAAVAVFRKKQL